MTKRTLVWSLLGVFLLAWAGIVLGQGNSPGGVFDPGRNIRLSAQWTYRLLSPWIIEGATDDAFETTVTFTEPTADRTETHQNATGTIPLGTAAYGVNAGSITLDGSNPSSVATGLSALTACPVITRGAAMGDGDDPIAFTTILTASAGRLDVYAWKTNGTDPTLTASTNSSTVVQYVCFGDR